MPFARYITMALAKSISKPSAGLWWDEPAKVAGQVKKDAGRVKKAAGRMKWHRACTLALWAVLACVATVFGAPPPGYYDSVDAGSAASLRATLHEVIDDHTRFPYTASSTDTWDILEAADRDPANPAHVLDLYRNASYPKAGGGNANYNREHSWPKSYGFPKDNAANYPFTDCHHLFICDSGYNSSRQNHPYRFCNASCTEKPTEHNNGQGGGTGVYPGNSNWVSGSGPNKGWETWIGRRGDVARAQFYMDVRYEGGTHGMTGAAEPDLVLTDDAQLIVSDSSHNGSVARMGMLSVLLAWHEQDPVDDLERARNDAVFTFQGNRNPFIDHPEWVACVFQGQCAEFQGQGASLWINELHYDNSSTDQGEFVEVAGPAGTDLTGWRLLGYNGRRGRLYRTIALSGTLADQGGCPGTAAFGFPGLQNGPDALALVDPQGKVVQFLSYEGQVVAADGPAAGQTSVDTGVRESRHTPAGLSLQLTGTGGTYDSFTWDWPAAETRGRPNGSQSFQGGCN